MKLVALKDSSQYLPPPAKTLLELMFINGNGQIVKLWKEIPKYGFLIIEVKSLQQSRGDGRSVSI